MSDRITGTTLSFSRKDYDSTFLVFHDSNPYLTRRLADSPLPDHAVRLLANGYLACFHSLRDKLSEESDRSRSSLFAGSVPYAAKIEIVEFFLDDLKLFLVSGGLFLCTLLLSFWGFDLFGFFLSLFWKLFRSLFNLGLARLRLLWRL